MYAIPAMIMLVAISCGKNTAGPQPDGNSDHAATSNASAKLAATQAAFSDQDLFSGIFFLKGGVADEIEVVAALKNELNNGQLNVLSDRCDNTVSYILENSPEFFKQFGALIRTGDEQRVLEGIDLAIETLTHLNIEIGPGPNLFSSEGGKIGGKKFIIKPHFLILHGVSELQNNGSPNVPEVTLEKEILVQSIVSSFHP